MTQRVWFDRMGVVPYTVGFAGIIVSWMSGVEGNSPAPNLGGSGKWGGAAGMGRQPRKAEATSTL
jgi:hypothetical protein